MSLSAGQPGYRFCRGYCWCCVVNSWEQGLREQYPELFKSYLQGRAIEVGKGWRGIVERVLAAIDGQTELIQIKEKFGGLRVYVRGGNEAVEEAIEQAEMEALYTCDVCGKDGRLGFDGFIAVRCDEHG